MKSTAQATGRPPSLGEPVPESVEAAIQDPQPRPALKVGAGASPAFLRLIPLLQEAASGLAARYGNAYDFDDLLARIGEAIDEVDLEMAASGEAVAPRFPRTHELLSRDITRDPIFLLQARRYWYSAATPYEWDSEIEVFRDERGEEVSRETLVGAGAAGDYWETVTVFLTREDGEDYGRSRAYRFPDGWRVYCVAAEGDLREVLGAATEGGRYR